MHAAVGAVSSEVDVFFYFKKLSEEQHWRLFSLDNMFWLYSRLALARILLNTAAHRRSPQGGDARLMSLLAPIESLELFQWLNLLVLLWMWISEGSSSPVLPIFLFNFTSKLCCKLYLHWTLFKNGVSIKFRNLGTKHKDQTGETEQAKRTGGEKQ